MIQWPTCLPLRSLLQDCDGLAATAGLADTRTLFTHAERKADIELWHRRSTESEGRTADQHRPFIKVRDTSTELAGGYCT